MKIGTQILIIALLSQSLLVSSQDFTNIKDRKVIKITGGVGAKFGYFGALNEDLKRDPVFYAFNANMNINIYGVLNVPLSFMYTKQNSKFNYPEYKQFGISPKYKAYTLHLGYRSIQFSQYTLSGLTFLGVGAEAKPKGSWFEVAALYGQFQKPIEFVDASAFDSRQTIIQQAAAYDRRGYGGKFTIKKNNQRVDLIIFKAKDRLNSIQITPELGDLAPAENLVMGINTQNKVGKNLSFQFEYAMSAFTKDYRMPDVEETSYSYNNNFGVLFDPKISSSFNSMLNTNLSFQVRAFGLGLNYKRIDPEYKTMGAMYLNNDLEEYTVNSSFNLFKNKLSLSGNFGLQHNNLDNKQSSTMTRLVGSLNVSWKVDEKLNASINYSNFSSNTIPTRINLLDSIKYMQVTKNIGLNTSYNWETESKKQSVNFIINYQNASTHNKNLENEQNSGNDVMNSNVSYNLNIKSHSINITTGINYSNFDAGTSSNSSLGPSLGINKSITDNKIKIGLSSVYLRSYINSEYVSTIINYNLNLSYKINKHQSITLSSRLLDREVLQSDVNSQQYQLNLNYKYRL